MEIKGLNTCVNLTGYINPNQRSNRFDIIFKDKSLFDVALRFPYITFSLEHEPVPTLVIVCRYNYLAVYLLIKMYICYNIITIIVKSSYFPHNNVILSFLYSEQLKILLAQKFLVLYNN